MMTQFHSTERRVLDCNDRIRVRCSFTIESATGVAYKRYKMRKRRQKISLKRADERVHSRNKLRYSASDAVDEYAEWWKRQWEITAMESDINDWTRARRCLKTNMAPTIWRRWPQWCSNEGMAPSGDWLGTEHAMKTATLNGQEHAPPVQSVEVFIWNDRLASELDSP